MRFTEIISEDANPKRQAAIAIAMKKAGKKPKGVAEGAYDDDDTSMSEKLDHLLQQGMDYKQAVKLVAKTYNTYPEYVVGSYNRWGNHNYEPYDDFDEQGVAEGENWSKHNNKRAGGMSKKSVSVYRREHPGSKIQTAVTTKPSKLKKGSKAAKRRASFCARMRGMKKHRTGAKTAHDPNSNINKSLRRWHCESIEELHELVMLAEQFIRNSKK